jgi:hypothetical protein
MPALFTVRHGQGQGSYPGPHHGHHGAGALQQRLACPWRGVPVPEEGHEEGEGREGEGAEADERGGHDGLLDREALDSMLASVGLDTRPWTALLLSQVWSGEGVGAVGWGGGGVG